MSDAVFGLIFLSATALSLTASWRLVASLERLGARFGLSEALLGMLAALAADGPEISSAVTAVARGEGRLGAGVILGSNVFNIAALIGLAGIVAGHIALHPRVIELAGAVAIWIAGAALLLALGILEPGPALGLASAVFVPYLLLLGVRAGRVESLPLPRRWSRWLLAAVAEEELELEHQPGNLNTPRRLPDTLVAVLGTAVVIGASVAMERSASTLGARHAVPSIITGAIVLAIVTSLPNAVAGVYLARRGRAPAVLSTALNSNAINILAGLLLPALFAGVAAPSAQATLVAASALAITVLALVLSYTSRGLARAEGVALVLAYIAFAFALSLSA